MIRPHKHLDINTSVLRVSALLIGKLKQIKIAKIDELHGFLKNNQGQDTSFNFFNALNFLFLLGLIEYKKEIDCIEWVS